MANTHANGGHFWGNDQLPDAEIISSSAAAEEMFDHTPGALALLCRDFVGDRTFPDPVEMFAGLARLRRDTGVFG